MTSSTTQDFIASLDAAGERHMVPYGEAKMVWRRFGEGAPLILLHGGHGGWLHWVRNIHDLSKTRSVWVPDMPGYGDSGTLGPHAGLEELIGSMVAMLEHLFGTDTDIDLAGFSFGALVSSNIAARRRAVRSLATFGASGHRGERRETLPLINWKKVPAEELDAAMRHNLTAHMIADPAKVDDLAIAVHTWCCQRTRFRSSDYARSANLHEIMARSPDVPKLIVYGADDVTATPSDVLPVFTQGFDNRRGEIIAPGGHWVQYERAPEVTRMLLEWLPALR
jgi:2-hydroxy-6-oxonona-2,4-dienedioate hydrolase